MPVIPLHSLGVATLFSARPGLPLLLSLRYSSEQLFYLVIVHPFEQRSQFVIYRHSTAHPEMAGNAVLEMGTEPWSSPQQSGPFLKPGWDVAPDSEQLAAQMIVMDNGGQGSVLISAFNLKDGSKTGLFVQAPAQILSHDLLLTWGPDSQSVVATESNPLTSDGPYSATLANPATTQQYIPNLVGQVAWRADSSAFELQNTDTASTAAPSDVYIFYAGQSQGQLLLKDARDFVWG